MTRLIMIFPILFIIQSHLHAQEKYWVFFIDKSAAAFDPYSYFDTKAIERRKLMHLPMFDQTDLPINQNYIADIKSYTKKITGESRWLNAISVLAGVEELEKIRTLACVKEIRRAERLQAQPLSAHGLNIRLKKQHNDKDDLLKKQISIMQGELFLEKGLDGKGIRIAVFDNGFTGVDKNPVFKRLRDEGRIIKTFDFIRNRENVYRHGQHGTMVLSCIAGVTESGNIGMAPGAEFLLARTETFTEELLEEENWLAAMEWADRNGANIISSSLGYTYHRYFVLDLNGKSSLVAKAAKIAANKGILVINAMGNEGDSNWQFMATPADADSILSVGGIDPSSNLHMNFSSFGPTSDMRMKPNVSAYAKVMAAGKKKIQTVYGTSFSTPLITGFAACLWQMKRRMTNMEILHEVERCGHLFPYYDYAHGYGIPQASRVLSKDHDTLPTFIFEEKKDTVHIRVLNHQNNSATNTLYNEPNLFFHIEGPGKYLERYAVLRVYDDIPLYIPLSELKDCRILRVHYKGYTSEFNRKN